MRKLKNEELGRLSGEQFVEAEKNPVCLILDDIRSMNNIGSVFRTADAFRISKIYLCGITATPPHRDIQKTALGATETVSWEYISEIPLLIDTLKLAGWTVASVEQADESLSLELFRPERGKKYAFVFGNEVFGVNEGVVKTSDIVLEIPQFGTKHSLNISVAVGVVLWDFLMKIGLSFKK